MCIVSSVSNIACHHAHCCSATWIPSRLRWGECEGGCESDCRCACVDVGQVIRKVRAYTHGNKIRNHPVTPSLSSNHPATPSLSSNHPVTPSLSSNHPVTPSLSSPLARRARVRCQRHVLRVQFVVVMGRVPGDVRPVETSREKKGPAIKPVRRMTGGTTANQEASCARLRVCVLYALIRTLASGPRCPACS